MRKSGSAKKMYRGRCSALNWKVFRRAGNRAGLAKDREVEEPSERFCLSMRLQGAPTSVLLDPRVVREARGRQVRDGSRDAEGDLSSGADAKTGPRGRTARLWENRARQSSCSRSRHHYRTSSVLRGYQ